ncbi:10809_t:CDS:2 [Funneliformis caledonium]|uniref:10809_t:CDS:1 n=1 Tax=Funneliformis caledonium TaxID=1117310 RepID=A0A9N9HU85_9GLOM|nr:10809_t:CDS:2 [Funneliformis caledonium]
MKDKFGANFAGHTLMSAFWILIVLRKLMELEIVPNKNLEHRPNVWAYTQEWALIYQFMNYNLQLISKVAEHGLLALSDCSEMSAMSND